MGAGWLCMRATLPTDGVKLPRWHRDGRYYSRASSDAQYKVVFTLKGPTTLFANPTQLQREQYERLEESDDESSDDMPFRKLVAVHVKLEPISLPTENPVKYRVGDQTHAVFHSEPDMNVPRLFLQILPGSKSNIAEWKSA